MAGGTWVSQNKRRPGAYINFAGAPQSMLRVGARGIGSLALPLHWGPQGELISVQSSDMLDERSLPKVGCTAFDLDENTLPLWLMLGNCATELVYRMDTGGAAAAATIDNLIVTAKYPGTLGNALTVSVVEDPQVEGGFLVRTYLNAELKDTQAVLNIAELVGNDFVKFSAVEIPEPVVEELALGLSGNAGVPLTGGTDGTVDAATAYPKYFAQLKRAGWQCAAILSDQELVNPLAAEFIRQMRDGLGKKCQIVLCDYDADYEGVINSVCGAVIDNREITPEHFTAYVAGLTAGAQVAESNTYKVIEGASAIVGELDASEIEEALGKGKLVLSARQDGAIVVEQDINSLHSFTPEKGYSLSKNRVIRTLDEIAISILDVWEKSYVGKVSNNEAGRAMLKSDIIAYLNELQRIQGLQNFGGADDVEVLPGLDADAVVVNLFVQPVDSMEKLYVTVTVGAPAAE